MPEVVYERATFFHFAKVLEEHVNANEQIKFLRRPKEASLRILDFKKLKLLKKNSINDSCIIFFFLRTSRELIG